MQQYKRQLIDSATRAFSAAEMSELPAQEFLERHSWLLMTELDSGMQTDFSRQRIYRQIQLPNLKKPDFIRREWTPSAGWVWEFIEIEPPGKPLLNADGRTQSSQLSKALGQIAEWQEYANSNAAALEHLLPGFAPPLYGRVIIGRSDMLNSEQRTNWRTIRSMYRHVKVRTYAWLIDKLEGLDPKILHNVESYPQAGGRSDLDEDRSKMLFVQSQPHSNSFSFHVEIRTEELEQIAKELLSNAESGEFGRTRATVFEKLVQNLRPDLAEIASEIREVVHDLDNHEPNITTATDLSPVIRTFLRRLK